MGAFAYPESPEGRRGLRLSHALFRLFMQSVLAAKAAMLFQFQPFLRGLFVLVTMISDALAGRAFQFNEIVLGHGKVY